MTDKGKGSSSPGTPERPPLLSNNSSSSLRAFVLSDERMGRRSGVRSLTASRNASREPSKSRDSSPALFRGRRHLTVEHNTRSRSPGVFDPYARPFAERRATETAQVSPGASSPGAGVSSPASGYFRASASGGTSSPASPGTFARAPNSAEPSGTNSAPTESPGTPTSGQFSRSVSAIELNKMGKSGASSPHSLTHSAGRPARPAMMRTQSDEHVPGKRRVRFPKDNDPSSKRILYPADENDDGHEDGEVETPSVVVSRPESPDYFRSKKPTLKASPSTPSFQKNSLSSTTLRNTLLNSAGLLDSESEDETEFRIDRVKSIGMMREKRDRVRSRQEFSTDDDEPTEIDEPADDEDARTVSSEESSDDQSEPEETNSVNPRERLSEPASAAHKELFTQDNAALGAIVGGLTSLGSFGSLGGMAPGAVERTEKSPNSSLSGHDIYDVPLVDLDRRLEDLKERQTADTTDTSEHEHSSPEQGEILQERARDLINQHKTAVYTPDADYDPFTAPAVDYFSSIHIHDDDEDDAFLSYDGSVTPTHEDYVAPPKRFKQGVLGALLKLYNEEDNKSASTLATTLTDGTSTGDHSPSGKTTQKLGLKKMKMDSEKRLKWYESRSASPEPTEEKERGDKPSTPGKLKLAKNLKKKDKEMKRRKKQEVKITVHIAELLQRQRFILRLCRALMLYGAPTHRLEEYMKMTSRVLEIDGQFLYIPGCMIVSFGDATTHTSEMQLVRCVQGVNLSKLQDTHEIYKEVVHDLIGVEEASNRLDDILRSKNLYPPWLAVLFFALGSGVVSPYAFGGRWADIPMCIVLGSIVGFFQIVVAPRSDLYNNVFEVSMSILIAFLARAIGTITVNGSHPFCFAAIAQGSLAIILPGYIVLCGSLELQSKNIVAGSIRMFYAVIYSMFLGFGITLGAVMYGWCDINATRQDKCPQQLDPKWKILFVPLYSVFIALVNQARLRQLPSMLIISGAGYAVTYFVGANIPDPTNSSYLTSAIGAFTIGILGNLYSRVGHGLAFAAMLPGIFVQVPSGVASQGSLVAAIANSNRLVGNRTITTTVYETLTEAATSTVISRVETTLLSQTSAASDQATPAGAANLGFTMIQVAIGITVGLFAATLCIYPFGKKRSGLFTF